MPEAAIDLLRPIGDVWVSPTDRALTPDELLEELKPDVVHTHSSKAGIIGRWAAKKAHVPVVIHTIHGLAFTASTNRFVNHAYKMLERGAAPITTRPS